MKPTPGIWRPLRYLLLVSCAAGLLAADNNWITTVRFDFANPDGWFSRSDVNDAADFPAALDSSIQTTQRAQMSTAGLTHGLFFSPPSGRWTLDSQRIETESSIASSMTEWVSGSQFNRGDNFASFKTQPTVAAAAAVSGPITSQRVTAPNTIIKSGTAEWAVDNSGTWTNSANWVGNNVPDGPGVTADFSKVDLTANRTVTLDSSRTVGTLTIGDTNGTHSYTLSASPGATLTFADPDITVDGVLTQSSTSAGDTISAPIVISHVNLLAVINESSSHPLNISGNISSTGGNRFIRFEIGNFNVTGAISDGAPGNIVTVETKFGAELTLTGTNTYTGRTNAVSGIVMINGNNSGATGLVYVGNGGTLGGTGTIGGAVSVDGGGFITGGTTSTVGTLTIGSLTLHQNLSFEEAARDSGYLVNLAGPLSDTLLISGNLILPNGPTHIAFSGSADGFTTYTLATYAAVSGEFTHVDQLPDGYELVYGPTQLLLVPLNPIPESATWIGGALALVAIGLVSRRRLRSLL